jgi:DedD protein
VAKTSISDEELQLRKRARRRLVGAIVLVLLVVVLVPMFLEREPRLQKHDMDIRIPPIPGQTQAPSIRGATQPPASAQPPAPADKVEAPPQPATPPAPEPPARPSAPSSAAEAQAPYAPAAKPQAPSPPPAMTAQRAAPAPQAGSEAPTKAPALTPSRELANGDAYIVQLGAFSSSANAKQLLHKLKLEKFPAYIEPVKTTQGEKTRVRVGPYPSVEVAEKARDRLKTLKLVFGNDARVMRAGE